MNLHFFGIDLELNSAYYKINLIFLLCAEPYSRPLAKCFVTPGIQCAALLVLPTKIVTTKDLCQSNQAKQIPTTKEPALAD